MVKSPIVFCVGFGVGRGWEGLNFIKFWIKMVLYILSKVNGYEYMEEVVFIEF